MGKMTEGAASLCPLHSGARMIYYPVRDYRILGFTAAEGKNLFEHFAWY